MHNQYEKRVVGLGFFYFIFSDPFDFMIDYQFWHAKNIVIYEKTTTTKSNHLFAIFRLLLGDGKNEKG